MLLCNEYEVQQFALFAQKQSGGTTTHPPCMTVKMVAAAITLFTKWSKTDPIPPFNFF